MLALGLAVLAPASCHTPTGLRVDLARYEPVPQVDQLDFGAVLPARTWPYWELRFSWASGHPADSVIGSGGALRRDELSPDVLAALDGLTLDTGFAGSCLPGWCFKFVAAVDESGEVESFSTAEALRSFLAPIGSREEAVLLLDALGFTWHGEGHGIRPFQDGWEAVVFELVEICAPIQTDRVLLQLAAAGEVQILGREVWARLEGACI